MADFFPVERLASLIVATASTPSRESSPMTTFIGPFAGRLSVVAAYVAIAFVGAIVLGVF
jgi:hypothetical protein